MATPTTAIQRFDLSLSYVEFAARANRQGYVGLQVMPPIAVAQETANFLRIPIATFMGKIEDTARAPKSEYSRQDYNWTQDSYNVQEHGTEETVDDASIERYGDILRAEIISTERAINRVLQRLEYDVAQLAADTSTFSHTAATATFEKANKSTATPIEDIDGAILTVQSACGVRPNTIVIPDITVRKLMRLDEIVNQVKYSGKDDPKKLVLNAKAILQDLFMVEQVLVPMAFYNTADNGQTPVLSRLWDPTKIFVGVVKDDGMAGDMDQAQPAVGRTIFSTKNGESVPGMDDGEASLIVEEYREERRRGGVVRARNKRQVKTMYAAAGYILTGCTS